MRPHLGTFTIISEQVQSRIDDTLVTDLIFATLNLGRGLSQGRRAGAGARANRFEMSAKLADILNDSEGTQSESDDADCGEGDAMQSSNELGEKSWSEGEDSDLGEDVPTKSRKKMKAKYKRKKADWEDVKSWDRDATEEDHIQQETINIANEFMQQCGLPFIALQQCGLPFILYVPDHWFALQQCGLPFISYVPDHFDF